MTETPFILIQKQNKIKNDIIRTFRISSPASTLPKIPAGVSKLTRVITLTPL